MMKKYFIHNAFFRLLAPVIYGILIYLLILLINNNVTQVNDLFNEEELYICIGLTYLSFESMRLIILLLSKLNREQQGKLSIPLQITLTTIASVGLVLAGLHLYFQYVLGFSISNTQLLIFTLVFAITAWLYNLLFYSSYYLQKENTARLMLEKQQREVLEIEMNEFKNDINPDLLYESLENLINLIYRDVDQAEAYIDNLATAYRYVLANRQEELVPVSQELEAANNLIRLLNEKYFGQLRFESSLAPGELDALLIPGSIPVVIESMVRNTIVSRFEPLTIRCYLEDEYITLQCKLNDRLMQHPETDMALTRLQKSYSIYSDLPMIKVKAYEENYIKLPVISFAEHTGTENY